MLLSFGFFTQFTVDKNTFTLWGPQAKVGILSGTIPSTLVNHIDKFANHLNNTLDREIQLNGIVKAAKHLKNEKSSGIDSISNEVIKCSLEVFGSLCVRIFNPRSLEGGGGMKLTPPSIFLALNFCSLTDCQKLWHNCSLFENTSFDTN